MSWRHDPVLVAETLAFLCNGAGLYLDATLGDGGHAAALLAAEPGSRLLGCDRDPASLAAAGERLRPWGDRVTLAHARFRDLAGAHARAGGEPLAGALFDLGLSSRQIDDPARGMSFMADGPLDLRMDPTSGESAATWLAGADEMAIANALRTHGDVRPTGRLARALATAARAGQLTTTQQLVRVVAATVGGRPHPRLLAQVFQALRIQVNGEAEDLDAALAWLPGAMRPGGVVVTLAYHSGEDRRIKRVLRAPSSPAAAMRLPLTRSQSRLPEGPWEPLTRNVVTPAEGEIAANPRARSARLRAFRRKAS